MSPVSPEVAGGDVTRARDVEMDGTMGMESIFLSLVEAKGWHLYRALRGSDFSGVVRQGKARSIARDVPYVMLPAASRDAYVDEVQIHVVNARSTNQLPMYRDSEHSSSQIEFVMIKKEGLSIKTKEEPRAYLIDRNDIDNAIKFNLSTYNVHSFPSIEELSEFFLAPGYPRTSAGPPAEPTALGVCSGEPTVRPGHDLSLRAVSGSFSWPEPEIPTVLPDGR